MNAQPNLPTDTSRGPLIDVSAWILLCVGFLATGVKVLTKWVLDQKLQLDDAFMSCSLLVAVGYVIALNQQVAAGLGRPEVSLGESQLNAYGKAQYASQLLYILSLGLAKMSLLYFLYTLRKYDRRLATKTILFSVCILFTVAFTAAAFQCALPRTWSMYADKCFNMVSFWEFFATMDISTDIVITILPVYLLHDLNIQRKALIMTILVFTARILLSPVIIIRLMSYISALGSTDITLEYTNAAILTTVHIILSILASCVPFLKRVMEHLQSGILNTEVRTSSREMAREDCVRVLRRPYDYQETYLYSADARSNPTSRLQIFKPRSNVELVVQKQTSIAVQYSSEPQPPQNVRLAG